VFLLRVVFFSNKVLCLLFVYNTCDIIFEFESIAKWCAGCNKGRNILGARPVTMSLVHSPRKTRTQTAAAAPETDTLREILQELARLREEQR